MCIRRAHSKFGHHLLCYLISVFANGRRITFWLHFRYAIVACTPNAFKQHMLLSLHHNFYHIVSDWSAIVRLAIHNSFSIFFLLHNDMQMWPWFAAFAVSAKSRDSNDRERMVYCVLAGRVYDLKFIESKEFPLYCVHMSTICIHV